MLEIIHNLNKVIVKLNNVYHVTKKFIVLYNYTNNFKSNSKFKGIFLGFGSQNPKCSFLL